MKRLFTFALLSLFISGMAFAESEVGETDTPCPYMAESNTRDNTKSVASDVVHKPSSSSAVAR
jgi:hypothetical protein